MRGAVTGGGQGPSPAPLLPSHLALGRLLPSRGRGPRVGAPLYQHEDPHPLCPQHRADKAT